MRWLAVCLLVIGLTQFAKANRRISVAELEHTLAVQRAAHLGDAENAKLLEGIELTERLTEHSLQRILTSTSPGPQASRVLEFLADTSAFLDPPANEFPQQPAPDLKSQQAMIGRAVDFVAVTLQHLPDFVVTRSTRSFDNISTSVSQSQRLILTSMHQVDAFDRQITYLNGREVVETRDSGK